MQLLDGRLLKSPTDIANFLACRRKTALDLLVARGRLAKPTWQDPLADVLRERGQEHERRYVERLRAQGLTVVDLGDVPYETRAGSTVDAMRAGADVIVQAMLTAQGWVGYADVLRRVEAPSPELGEWSYEVHDTKLSRETRGGTILQLCAYTEMLGGVQGLTPEYFRVVTPVGVESYRFDEFAAFYRQVKAGLIDAVERVDMTELDAGCADPVDHCDVCRWFSRCNAERRKVDHLAFVAGISRRQRNELVEHDVETLAALATMPWPPTFVPRYGSAESYGRLREQARLQFEARESREPRYELLPIEAPQGLSQLPEPRPGDLFLDLEGDPFARPVTSANPGEGNREYLFGLGRVEADGTFSYTARWAITDAEEQAAFDLVMTDIMAAIDADPSIHVYHYAPYEPTAFKRLMGRYATREADVDRLLRGGRFVDLLAIVRHSVRAGVERYSIKDLEPLYGFTREIALEAAGDQRRLVEIALETHEVGLITSDVRDAVEAYNRDDCRSTLELRIWLESLRAAAVARGVPIARPVAEPDAPSEKISDRQQQVNDLRARLLRGLPLEAKERSPDEHAQFLLAYLLDWHYREDKVSWWEYFRLLDLGDDELLDEPAAVARLEFVEHVDVVRNKTTGRPTGSVIDRYRYPPQDCEIRAGSVLKLRDKRTFGEVVADDRQARTLDVKKGRGVAEVHPASAFAHENVNPGVPAASLLRLGQRVVASRLTSARPSAVSLLRRCVAGLGEAAPAGASEPVTDYAVRLITHGSRVATLPIQGPPGSGKTFTGARMIYALVAQGLRVGVTATSHKVIRNLLRAVAKDAATQHARVRLGHRVTEASVTATDGVVEFDDHAEARTALADHTIDVLGGTAWVWARPDFEDAVDVLFIDEAGQMSLANALAVSQAARSLVLLGDPQQLEQPQKGSHPDGVDVSALDHILDGHKTMPADRGLFLPITWRLAPAICDFTSEVFYERKLAPGPGLDRQRLSGTGRFDGAGLFVVHADHDGCRNASDEEVDVVGAVVDTLLTSGAAWIDEHGQSHALTTDDILVVGPYNAHVTRLQERLGPRGVSVGTVDKFQGQEAPIVIYSMATSRPEDAPRGMEFLYSLNRLNVATSRARCVCVLVASPRLFNPECRTPRQMQLANALARYREMAAMPFGAGAGREGTGRTRAR